MTTAERKDLPDWDAPPIAHARATPLGAVVASAVVLVAVVAGAAWFAGPVAAAVALAIAGVVVVVAAATARKEGERLLAGTRRVGDSPRLTRLVAGISGDLSMEPPDVWVVPDGELNAFVTVTPEGGAVAIAAGLVDALTLTELEAVVAHCLARLRLGVSGPAWARLVPGWTRRVPACAPATADVRAAAITRYPPGLAAAITKCEPRDGREQGLWFVPRASGECTPAARAAALEDL